jgi:hypothetical protein
VRSAGNLFICSGKTLEGDIDFLALLSAFIVFSLYSAACEYI